MLNAFQTIQCACEAFYLNTVYDFSRCVQSIVASFPDGIWKTNHFFHLFKAADGIRMQVARFIRSELYAPITKLNDKKTTELVPNAINNSYLILSKNSNVDMPELVKPVTEVADFGINQLLPKLNLIISDEQKEDYGIILRSIKEHVYDTFTITMEKLNSSFVAAPLTTLELNSIDPNNELMGSFLKEMLQTTSRPYIESDWSSLQSTSNTTVPLIVEANDEIDTLVDVIQEPEKDVNSQRNESFEKEESIITASQRSVSNYSLRPKVKRPKRIDE